MQGRAREGLRFLRETEEAWSVDPAVMKNGSTLDHHLLSHKATLNMQLKQYSNAMDIVDNALAREEQFVEKGVLPGNEGMKQDLLRSDHINDYIQIFYRMELLGEGMGDRWSRVSRLLDATEKKILAPMDVVYRSILFSITGEEQKLRALLESQESEERDALWKEFALRREWRVGLSVAETEIKWNHVNGEDRMDVMAANPLISPCVNALLELNNVENAVVWALGTL